MYNMDTLEGSLGFERGHWGLNMHKDQHRSKHHQRSPKCILDFVLWFVNIPVDISSHIPGSN